MSLSQNVRNLNNFFWFVPIAPQIPFMWSPQTQKSEVGMSASSISLLPF